MNYISTPRLWLGLFLWVPIVAFAQFPRSYHAPEFAANWSAPGLHPDHIVLNPTEDPATGISITWRTSPEVDTAYVEIAPATAAPTFWRNGRTLLAQTQTMDATGVVDAERVSNYHALTLEDLEPGTLYAYRVGDGRIWSEWFQFRTASREAEPFSFLYVGDAQNFILELWSRLVREGYRKAPDASFIIHAGDLVNSAHSEQEWHEWFMAGGWIHSMLPSLPTPGNHEYQPRSLTERRLGVRSLSEQWRPQFTLPDNGPDGLKETVYYVDYQGARIISLNSNERPRDQAKWLEGVLANNPNKWTIVTFHHPLYSAAGGRDQAELRNFWKPLLDEYGVDIALQGHDHTYARGHTLPSDRNLVRGQNIRDYSGTVYVVSVSGGKMYQARPDGWEQFPEVERDRLAENTQLFQVIDVAGDTLSYASYTATGELYDAFDLIKSAAGGPNRFVERRDEAIPERRHDNTIPYYDQLPAGIAQSVRAEFPDYEIEAVNILDSEEFRGYRVRLRDKDNRRLLLLLDPNGTVVEMSE
jgi:hypothetical protein